MDIVYCDIRTAKAEKKKAENRVKDLETDELAELKKTFAAKESGLKSEKARADNAEQSVSRLEAENDKLKKELENRRAEDVVIEEFKKSEEYDSALANAAAPEIQRCWIIAEKHIKTDPNALWGSFVDEFVAAKKALEDGLGEPEPYNGPSRGFIPAPAPLNPDQD